MPELFFNSSGTGHMEFIPEGATVIKHHYKEILCHLLNSIRCTHPELLRRQNWLLLNGNTPAYHSVLVQEELAKQQITILQYPPYALDLALCDFSFVPHVGVNFNWLKKAVFPAAISTLVGLHSG
jgi:hypothetical protein